jgi:uncharacterized phage protein (TIGR01671 family)
MNREIKFRVWDGYLKEMLYGFDIPEFCIEWGWNPEENKNYILMQCTGLKDKKGKDMYESDIVIGKGYIDDIIKGTTKDIIFEIVWREFDACFALKYKENDVIQFLAFEYGHCQVEVIGNIFENKESLNEV